MANEPVTSGSPNGRHVIARDSTREESLGRPLFRLRLNGVVLDSRRGIGKWLFGEEVVWSTDSRYLAAQRWDLPDRGPQTSILLIDLEEGLWQVVGPGYRAVMRPVSFHGTQLDFETLDLRTGETTRGRADCASALTRWGDLQDVMVSAGDST